MSYNIFIAHFHRQVYLIMQTTTLYLFCRWKELGSFHLLREESCAVSILVHVFAEFTDLFQLVREYECNIFTLNFWE